MKLLYTLKDEQFEKTVITHTRKIARGILMNSKGEVCLLHVFGDDLFGHRDYYETPGGGIEDNETPEQAIIREIKEETGCDSHILAPIGIVEDDYNKIQRHNINYYFLLKVEKYGEQHLLEYEKQIIESIYWLPIKEAIVAIENVKETPISFLVKKRELPIYYMAQDILNDIITTRGEKNGK